MVTLSQLSLASSTTVVVERQSCVASIYDNELDRRCADTTNELPLFCTKIDDDVVSEQSINEMQPALSSLHIFDSKWSEENEGSVTMRMDIVIETD